MAASIGPEQAKTIGDNHEADNRREGQPQAEEDMDKNNNAVGRACGTSRGNRTCPQKCLDQVIYGGLKWIED